MILQKFDIVINREINKSKLFTFLLFSFLRDKNKKKYHVLHGYEIFPSLRDLISKEIKTSLVMCIQM